MSATVLAHQRRAPRATGVRVGCDIGGTFTDIVLALPEGTLHIGKVSTIPDDPGRAVVEGVVRLLREAGLPPDAVTEVVHGTTAASNTILQKTGAKTGVLTTRGFRDVLEIGRIRTPTMFDFAWHKPEPLAPRRYRVEIGERVAADGAVVRALDPDDVRAAGKLFAAEGVNAVAICFINSYRNPVHELAAKAILEAEFPDLLVTASCEVLPEVREYERCSTTVVNAYILPAMRVYLSRLQRDLAAAGVHAPIQVMASHGGMIGIAAASHKPVFAVASGPAGGVTGVARLGEVTGDRDAIVFDMGGTTAKAAIVTDGLPAVTNEYEFRDGISAPSRFVKGGGYVLKVPAIDIAEVGAGGGSVAYVDAGNLLHVGPESVGAHPGPACYALGNDRPTVTDANMVLGLLNPVALAGGSLRIDPARSHAAIAEHVAARLGVDVFAAAHGIREVANVNMARAIRAVTVERGRDPRDLTLVAFGGGGPVHAVAVAKQLGITRIVAPVMAGVFCSAGMLAALPAHEFVRAVLRPLAQCTPAEIQRIADDLAEQGQVLLATEGIAAHAAAFERRADLRFVGQSSELTIALPDGPMDAAMFETMRSGFLAAYRETFGYAADEPVELVNLRLVAKGTGVERLDFASVRMAPGAVAGATGSRPVHFERGQPPVETPVVARGAMTAEPRQGPLIVESYDTTVVVPPGTTVHADPIGNLIIAVDA